MSHEGLINVIKSNPSIPTSFPTDSGTAIPAGNVLNILGGTFISTAGSGNTVTISYTGPVFAETLTGNSGGVVAPIAGNINTIGTGSITIVGNPGTSTLVTQLTGLVNHNVLVGAGTATITSVSPGATGLVLTSNGPAGDPSFQSIGSLGAITSITGNSGGAEVPLAGNFNILGTGSITVAGTANTETISLTGLTNHAVLVGAGTATITNVGPTATAGQVLQSGGAAADPSFSTPTYPSASGSAGVILRSDGTNNVYTTATYPATTTINQILYSSSANTIAGITAGNNGVLISSAGGIPSWLPDGTTGQFLTATTGAPPSWTTVAPGGVTSVTGTANQILASPTTGAVVLSLIGPYTPATYTAHGVLVGEGTSSIVAVGPTATVGQVLQSAGAAADPAFSTATYPLTTTINQVLYSSSANVIGGITASNNGVLISGTTGIPSWLAAGTTGQVLTATTGNPASWASPATSGTVTSVSVVSANGFAGTVATATTTPAITISTTITGVLSGNGTAISGSAVTQFDVLVGGASNAISSVGPGSAGQVLQSGGNASNPVYSTATYPATTTVSQILYSSSSNVVAGLATANRGVLTTSATGVPVITALATDGQLIIGSTAGAPAAATLTPGAGISITNASNSITIATSGSGVTWTDATGATQALAVQNGYVTDRGGGVVYTLPASASLGDMIDIVGKTGLATITPNANQQILIGSASGTVGVTGTAVSNNAGDCITLVCITAGASTVWRSNSVVGTWTLN